MIKLKDIEKVFWIDRDEAVKHLTDGFVEIFGKENREFFESIQDEMIEEGISAGRKGYGKARICNLSMFEVIQKFAKSEEEAQLSRDWFLKFFTKKELEIVTDGKHKERISGGVTGSIYPYYKNTDKYEKMFTDRFEIRDCDGKCDGECYCNAKPPKLYRKSPPSFKYFKGLKHSFMSINMFGEGGLSLDRWNSSELNYMLEEGEWFYYPESMHLSYYYLGAQIGKCQLKEEFFNEILDNIAPGITYDVHSSIKSALEAVSTDYDEWVLVPLIREEFKKK